MFYLRPGNLYKDFVIEPHIAEKSTTGRATAKYDTESRQLLRGVLSDASPEAIERFSHEYTGARAVFLSIDHPELSNSRCATLNSTQKTSI